MNGPSGSGVTVGLRGETRELGALLPSVAAGPVRGKPEHFPKVPQLPQGPQQLLGPGSLVIFLGNGHP